VGTDVRKKLSDAVHGFLGSWAYFLGNCMADGFSDRWAEIQDEEELEELKAQNPEKVHGPN
jgi:hypothetical protein